MLNSMLKSYSTEYHSVHAAWTTRKSDCNFPCTGNSRQTCGGGNRPDLYRNNGILSPLSSPARSSSPASSSSPAPSSLAGHLSLPAPSSLSANSSSPASSSLSVHSSSPAWAHGQQG